MKELLRCNDPVLISSATALLQSAGIKSFVFDQSMSVIEGSLGILPLRLMVASGDAGAAWDLLVEAGLLDAGG